MNEDPGIANVRLNELTTGSGRCPRDYGRTRQSELHEQMFFGNGLT